MQDGHVLIGRIIKPHGIRGEVVVDVLSDVDGRFAPGVEMTMSGRPPRPVTVQTVRPHQGRLLVRFDAVADRTEAETLRGRELTAEAIDLADEGQFFVSELLGLRVLGPDDVDHGVVIDLIEMPPVAGYDLLEVKREDGTTWMLPTADDLVDAEEVEREDGTVAWILRLIDPPAGLVDDTEAVAVQPAPLPPEERDQ